jgi:DNA-binding GntR family transcriptional regulator
VNRITEVLYLKDIAYSKIKDLIITDQIKGPMISENELALLLNMSRTPIREALHKLQNDNFVEIYPKRGVYIKEITVDDANDLMNVRLAIELFSIDTIADRFSDADVHYLEVKIQEQENAERNKNIYEFIKADLEFHEYLLKVSGNEYFVKTLNNVSDRLFHHGMKTFKRDMSRIQKSIEDHKIMLEQLRNRDFEKVKDLLEKHIQKGKKEYLST